MLEICKKLNCNIFLANNKTCDYANKNIFFDSNIEIKPQNYKQIIYEQKYKGENISWLSNLSKSPSFLFFIVLVQMPIK